MDISPRMRAEVCLISAACVALAWRLQPGDPGGKRQLGSAGPGPVKMRSQGEGDAGDRRRGQSFAEERWWGSLVRPQLVQSEVGM